MIILFPAPTYEVYYVTYGEGVKVLSPETSQVSTLVSTTQILESVAYDTMRNKLYWSNFSHIYHCDPSDASKVETVLATTQCKLALAMTE